MKRRDFLLKAAEAAALALFGGMGLAEVTKTIIEKVRERNAVNQLASQVTKHLSALQQQVEKCWRGKNILVRDTKKGLTVVGLIVERSLLALVVTLDVRTFIVTLGSDLDAMVIKGDKNYAHQRFDIG
ncbi:MAG: hypothetical protein N3B10_05200 [Armatimonadetes bacterium]|nr:hypothetical protein [Armatimonadota bacterium]MCX7967871.1 hypothetical protein [Armatimonadota bacterium]MDW8142484.1 hypothetical protein [Armatimonadota bacterium]